MKATTKTTSYIKRMITMRKWKDTLPSLAKIAETVSVSTTTVRKAVRILEAQRVIENSGSLGYTIIPKQFDTLYKKNKKLYYLSLLTRNIQVADMLDKGGKIIGNFAFLGNEYDMIVANIITGARIKTSLSELKALNNEPITVNSMLDLKGSLLRKAKTKYKRQTKLNDIKNLIFRNRKELGL